MGERGAGERVGGQARARASGRAGEPRGRVVTNGQSSSPDISIPEAQFADAVNIRSHLIADTSDQLSPMARSKGQCARSEWPGTNQDRLWRTNSAIR